MFRRVYIYFDTVQVWVRFKIKALHSGELWQCCYFLFTVKLLLPFLPSTFIKLSFCPGRKICVCASACVNVFVRAKDLDILSSGMIQLYELQANKWWRTWCLQYKIVLQRYCRVVLYYGRDSLLCFFCSLFCIHFMFRNRYLHFQTFSKI